MYGRGVVFRVLARSSLVLPLYLRVEPEGKTCEHTATRVQNQTTCPSFGSRKFSDPCHFSRGSSRCACRREAGYFSLWASSLSCQLSATHLIRVWNEQNISLFFQCGQQRSGLFSMFSGVTAGYASPMGPASPASRLSSLLQRLVFSLYLPADVDLEKKSTIHPAHRERLTQFISATRRARLVHGETVHFRVEKPNDLPKVKKKTSSWVQPKRMKNLEMNLELQTLKPLYLCYIFIKDQQPVRKDQLPVPTLRNENSEYSDEFSARSQNSSRIVFYPDLCSDQWWALHGGTVQLRLEHISMQPQLGHFVLWLRTTEHNRMSAIWPLCSVCSGHDASTR